MTNQSPRIYVYKITFLEIPHYYYGVHKEKKFNEFYLGSPVTYKDLWEFYTPIKTYIEFFDFTDEGYIIARHYENSLIEPVYTTDPLCLNRNCGGVISLEINRITGIKNYKEKKGIHAQTIDEKRKLGEQTYKKGKGFFSFTPEQKSEVSRKNGKKTYEEKKGIHAMTFEERSEISKITVKKLMEDKKGIHALTTQERSETAKKVNAQKWQCTETGYTTNAGALTIYQKNRGIDTSNRIRIS
jgi:hypothetical protein